MVNWEKNKNCSNAKFYDQVMHDTSILDTAKLRIHQISHGT